MASARATNGLAWFVGGTFVVLGIVEVVVRVVSSEPIDPDAIAFWFLSLCGGGTLVLLGSFVVTRPRWASLTMVTVGCLAGTFATMWTIVLPVCALTLLFLTVTRPRESTGQTEPEPTPEIRR